MLAAFGVVVCVAGAVAAAVLDAPVWCAVLAVLAAIALVDLAVVLWRKLRGEPG